MNLPSYINLELIGTVGVLVLAVTQYIKSCVPEKLIPVASILIGIGAAFLLLYDPKVGSVDPIVMIANGVLGAIGADTGYQFLGSRSSPPLSLPSKNGSTINTARVANILGGGK